MDQSLPSPIFAPVNDSLTGCPSHYRGSTTPIYLRACTPSITQADLRSTVGGIRPLLEMYFFSLMHACLVSVHHSSLQQQCHRPVLFVGILLDFFLNLMTQWQQQQQRQQQWHQQQQQQWQQQRQQQWQQQRQQQQIPATVKGCLQVLKKKLQFFLFFIPKQIEANYHNLLFLTLRPLQLCSLGRINSG